MTRKDSEKRDAALIKAVMWFINPRIIKSTRQVEEVFAKAAGQRLDIDGGNFQTVRAEDLFAYIGGKPPPDRQPHHHQEGDRGVARELILDALQFGQLSEDRRKALAGRLHNLVTHKVHHDAIVTTGSGGRVHFEYRPKWDGVEAIVAHVALLLLSDPLRRRKAGRCKKCNVFFYNANYRGKDQQAFCKTSHRVAHWQKQNRISPRSKK